MPTNDTRDRELAQLRVERDWLLAEADDDTRKRYFAVKSTERDECPRCRFGGSAAGPCNCKTACMSFACPRHGA